MTAPLHLYPLCENCGATICPPAAEFSCEHVCGASRVAPEAPCGRSSLNFPGASASGLFGRRFRFSNLSTHSFRARASFKTRSVAKPMGGAITAHGAAQAISQARARGENLPSFTAVPNVMGRLAKLPTNQQGQQ